MRILIRASAFVTGWAVFFLVVVATRPGDGDANIGLGLLAFLLVAVAAGVWGWRDGSRVEYGAHALTWSVVGVLLGLIVPLFTALVANEFDADVVATDILTVGPFTAALVAVPALAAGALAMVVHRSPVRRE